MVRSALCISQTGIVKPKPNADWNKDDLHLSNLNCQGCINLLVLLLLKAQVLFLSLLPIRKHRTSWKESTMSSFLKWLQLLQKRYDLYF